MAYFRSFFGGGEKSPDEDDGLEIVEKLVGRLETCTDQEDRRDALRTLRSMAKVIPLDFPFELKVKKLRVAVGSLGMNAFINVMEKERQNHELFGLSLDCLTLLLSNPDDDNTDDDELGERFAEVSFLWSIDIFSVSDDAPQEDLHSRPFDRRRGVRVCS